MPSSAFTIDANSEIPEFVVVYLVTMTAGATTVRLCSDASDFVSRTNTFTACGDAIDVALYEEREDVPPRAKITLHNVTPTVIETLRGLDPRTDATVLIEIVTSDEPDTVQASWSDAIIRSVAHDSLSIECELTVEHLVGIQAPALSFTPNLFPAMHARSASA